MLSSFPVNPFLSQEEIANLHISKLEVLEQNRATFYLCMYSVFNISAKCSFFLSTNEQKSSRVIYLDQYFYPTLQMQTDQFEWLSSSIAGNSLTTATEREWRQSSHNPKQTQSERETMMGYGEHKSMIWNKKGTWGEGKQGSVLRTNHTVLLPNKQTLFHLQKEDSL